RKTPEVEIEGRVVAATRTFARDIGTQIAPGFAFGHSAFAGAPAAGDSPIVTAFPSPTGAPTPSTGDLIGSTATKGAIPLFSNLAAIPATSGFTFSTVTADFRLDVLITAAESRGLLKVLSRPHVVTQNNLEAIVRQGVRVPVVTQAQLGGPPTVQ